MKMESLLSSPAIINTVLSILGLIVSYLVTRILKHIKMSEQRTIVYESLVAAAQNVWDESLRDIKDHAEDGKLTESERARAFVQARRNEIDIAKDKGIDLLKVVVSEELPSLIHRIIARRKKGEL